MYTLALPIPHLHNAALVFGADCSCVTVITEFMPNVRDIALMPLYDKLFDTIYPPRFILFKGSRVLPSVVRSREREAGGNKRMSAPQMDYNPVLSDKLAERVGTQTRRDVMASWKTVLNLVEKSSRENKEAGGVPEAIRDRFPLQVWQLLKNESPGLCRYWERKLKRRETLAGKEHVKLGVRMLDIYVWAVLLGNSTLALSLLPKCREPIRAAIIGVRLFKCMAKRLPLHRETLEAFAVEHEAWATNMLDLCKDYELASHLLTCPSDTFQRNVIQLALHTGCRKCE